MLGASAYTVWYWHDVGMDQFHARYAKFAKLTRLVHEDPAFSNIELDPPSQSNKDYWIQGEAAFSQADLDRLKSLVQQYHFLHYMGE